jgi:biotin transporter BioY
LGLLDREFTLITVAIYILLGFIGYPIFAMGGGWHYIFQYGVGYIISYIPAVFFSGLILNRKYNIKNVFKAVLAGVIIINIIGALVLLIIACLKHESWFMIKNMLYSLSGFKFIYDIVFSIIAVYLALITKKLLWII